MLTAAGGRALPLPVLGILTLPLPAPLRPPDDRLDRALENRDEYPEPPPPPPPAPPIATNTQTQRFIPSLQLDSQQPDIALG